MQEIVNILAADDDGGSLITLVIFIVIAGFTVLARYLEQRLKGKADQQPKEADEDAAGRRQARPDEQAPRERLKPVRRASPFESTQAPQIRPVGERETEQLPPELRRATPAPPHRPRAARPAPPPTRAPRQRQQARAHTVEEEMGRLQTHMRKREQLRAQRMETETPLEADTSAIDSRILRIRPSVVAAAQSGQRLHVDLADLAAARAAIVYHEILSPPKALREGPEMWDP